MLDSKYKRTREFIKRNSLIVGTVIMILLLLTYIILKEQDIKSNGVFTIAKVTKYEGDADGSSLYLNIYINGAIVQQVVNQGCEGNCVGKYYFVKVLLDDPSHVTLYGDKNVPDCILSNSIPNNGWKEIPECP